MIFLQKCGKMIRGFQLTEQESLTLKMMMLVKRRMILLKSNVIMMTRMMPICLSKMGVMMAMRILRMGMIMMIVAIPMVKEEVVMEMRMMGTRKMAMMKRMEKNTKRMRREKTYPTDILRSTKLVDGYSDDTTGSEYDDDADDDPGYGSLLRHAREVYAVTSFCLFESEYEKKRTLSVDVTSEKTFVFEYKVRKSGQFFREYKVTAAPFDGLINCSCKYFDLVGILCCHALIVLGCLRIEKIPERYILKWWRKNRKGGTGEETQSLTDNYKGHGSSSDFIHHIRLMDTGIFHPVHSKDDLDMLTKHVDARILSCGFFSYMRSGTMSQEENKRLEHLSVDPVHMDLDCEEREPMHSRYHVDAPLLRHARDIYMPNIYHIFREEHRESEYIDVYIKTDIFDDHGLVFDFEVLKLGQSRCHKVHAEPDDGGMKCSCKGFEKKGILCRHALSVMDRLFIERVPAKYILEKFAKNPGVGLAEGIHGEKYSELQRFVRWKTLNTMYDRIAQKAAKSDATQTIFLEHMEKLRVMLGCSSDEANETSMNACAGGGDRDMNGLGSRNAIEDKAMKKAKDLNYGQNLFATQCRGIGGKKGSAISHLWSYISGNNGAAWRRLIKIRLAEVGSSLSGFYLSNFLKQHDSAS